MILGRSRGGYKVTEDDLGPSVEIRRNANLIFLDENPLLKGKQNEKPTVE